MSHDDELLSNDQAAAMLRQRPQTLRSWRCRARGPRFMKLGSRVYYRRADIVQWMTEQTRDPEQLTPSGAAFPIKLG